MKPIVNRGKAGKRIVMEVIGEDGLKVGEYVDKGDKRIKEPYYLVEEASL